MLAVPAFLNVESSLTGKRWVGPSVAHDRQAQHLAQMTGHPPAVCAILARLGVEAEQVEQFLAPSLRDLLPDPRNLKDMKRAAERFLSAVSKREKIAVFADYDVDGATSAALLITWLRQMGLPATLYVPDRIDEGYGPNAPAMSALARDHDLIVCVDCGTLSHDAIAAAKGADVIILDHHLGGETLPDAHAVVNPNRQDESGELAHLCAAAVVFLMLVECGRQLRENGTKGPDLMSMLDLVGLATVADVAPLIGINRAFVRQGLKVMAQRKRLGLRVLSDTARLDTAPTPYHLGFVLGPRINAGGRIGQADLGARLLSTEDPHEAAALAERLETLNSERREVEAAVRAAAIEQAEDRGFDAPLVWASGDGWHPGVVGIVASRLKEKANRPSIVIGFEDDIGKGSGRSVSGVDLGAAIQRLAMDGLIEKGGGHKMAAGLTVTRAQLEPAMQRLSELLAKQGADARGPVDLRCDAAVMPGAATVSLLEQLDTVGPFGASAPAPRFVLPSIRIGFAKRVGESHLKLTLRDDAGTTLDAIAFGAFESDLGQALTDGQGSHFHIAGRLEVNSWGGRQRVQMRVEDAAPAQT
ncbi:single-stranded-DNA-specific exonuclease RecJ [Shimia ponticola]|uniref:single-stranded-DNA-specific exonuclease RecJ n=1 Tax=Shimia ponticola TaxID=2582893 RepID=UPI0011BF0EE0|nr:single-stranded-DNA-specific exonuclease RecJ [Shimia ponticola]